MRAAIKSMENGNPDGQDDMPVAICKCLERGQYIFLTRLFNIFVENERMSEE